MFITNVLEQFYINKEQRKHFHWYNIDESAVGRNTLKKISHLKYILSDYEILLNLLGKINCQLKF